jgi:hypothetical protein
MTRPFWTDIRDVGELEPGATPYADATVCRFTGGAKSLQSCGRPATRGYYCAEHGARMYAGVPVRKKKAAP